MNSADVVVIGLGAMGISAMYQLARRGIRVVGFDKCGVPNRDGASYGPSKIHRLAYHEDPAYLPMILRSHGLWRDLENEASVELLRTTGSIDAGRLESEIVRGALNSCRLHDLSFELLENCEITRRFPAYRFPPETVAVFQPDGGVLNADACMHTLLTLALRAGAEVHPCETVVSWTAASGGIAVCTPEGEWCADALILAPGRWLPRLVPDLEQMITLERQVVAWFEPRRPKWYEPEIFPVFNALIDDVYYSGCPVFGVPGFKYTQVHHRREISSPEACVQNHSFHDERFIRSSAERFFPDGVGRTLAMDVCWFDNSPDGNFFLGPLPGHSRVFIAGGFSGHGFKFAPVVGEILADFVEIRANVLDVSAFRLDRFLK